MDYIPPLKKKFVDGINENCPSGFLAELDENENDLLTSFLRFLLQKISDYGKESEKKYFNTFLYLFKYFKGIISVILDQIISEFELDVEILQKEGIITEALSFFKFCGFEPVQNLKDLSHGIQLSDIVEKQPEFFEIEYSKLQKTIVVFQQESFDDTLIKIEEQRTSVGKLILENKFNELIETMKQSRISKFLQKIESNHGDQAFQRSKKEENSEEMQAEIEILKMRIIELEKENKEKEVKIKQLENKNEKVSDTEVKSFKNFVRALLLCINSSKLKNTVQAMNCENILKKSDSIQFPMEMVELERELFEKALPKTSLGLLDMRYKVNKFYVARNTLYTYNLKQICP